MGVVSLLRILCLLLLLLLLLIELVLIQMWMVCRILVTTNIIGTTRLLLLVPPPCTRCKSHHVINRDGGVVSDLILRLALVLFGQNIWVGRDEREDVLETSLIALGVFCPLVLL